MLDRQKAGEFACELPPSYPYGERDIRSHQLKRANPKNKSFRVFRDERTVYSSTLQSTTVGETVGARHARRKQSQDPDLKHGKSRANGRI